MLGGLTPWTRTVASSAASTFLVCGKVIKRRKQKREIHTSLFFFCFQNNKHHQQSSPVVEYDSQAGTGHLTFLQWSLAPLACLSVNVTESVAEGLPSAGWRQPFVHFLKGRTLSVCPRDPRGTDCDCCLFFRTDGHFEAEYKPFSVCLFPSLWPSWHSLLLYVKIIFYPLAMHSLYFYP